MSDRFFADSDFATDTVELTGSELHHLSHVMRKRAGDVVTVFNGRGKEAEAEIVETSRRSASLRVIAVREIPPDHGRRVTLAVSIPKGDRFRWLAEKATELGVQRIIPLQTERTVVDPRAGKLDKIRQAVIETAKQCRAGRLTEITVVTSWADFLAGKPSQLFLAHPGGKPLATAIAELPREQELTFAIGPEGGFTADEIAQAEAGGAIPIDLGPRILRIETAAIAVAALARLQY